MTFFSMASSRPIHHKNTRVYALESERWCAHIIRERVERDTPSNEAVFDITHNLSTISHNLPSLTTCPPSQVHSHLSAHQQTLAEKKKGLRARGLVFKRKAMQLGKSLSKVFLCCVCMPAYLLRHTSTLVLMRILYPYFHRKASR